jgi:hypothetical protein
MEALKIKSDWFLISKTISANKTTSKLLSTWPIETMILQHHRKKEKSQQRAKVHCNIYLSIPTHN